MDKIAEANDLFDAVLTGTVNQDKTTTISSRNAPVREGDKSTDAKPQKAGNSHKKLSIYIGNFPWVSTALWVLTLNLVLLKKDGNENVCLPLPSNNRLAFLTTTDLANFLFFTNMMKTYFLKYLTIIVFIRNHCQNLH